MPKSGKKARLVHRRENEKGNGWKKELCGGASLLDSTPTTLPARRAAGPESLWEFYSNAFSICFLPLNSVSLSSTREMLHTDGSTCYSFIPHTALNKSFFFFLFPTRHLFQSQLQSFSYTLIWGTNCKNVYVFVEKWANCITGGKKSEL